MIKLWHYDNNMYNYVDENKRHNNGWYDSN
jgi:hypothetical protein